MNIVEKLENRQCRTCYNATKGLRLLKSVTKCGSSQQQHKTFAELLRDVSNINVMEDTSKALPKFICDSCARKLKTAHAFIHQTHAINERLMTMLVAGDEVNNQLDCLQEAQVDIQSCLEIKMEDEDAVVGCRAENETHCRIVLKMEESEELPEINHLGLQETRGKRRSEENNTAKQLATPKELNKLEFDLNKNKNETNEDTLKMDSTIPDCEIITDTKPQIGAIKDDEKDATDSDSEEDYEDDQTEETEPQHKEKEMASKKEGKKTTKKSKASEEKPAKDEDVAVPCSQCNKIFNNAKALARHQRTSHIPEDQKCTCPLCFRKFSRSCNMYTHMRTFHGPDTVPLIRKPSTQERIFQCDKCPRNYTKKKHLNIHIKNKHSHGDDGEREKDNETITTATVTTADDINSASENMPAKPNKPKRYEVRSLCSICGSSFSSKTHLIVHMRRHTGERPFKCDLCDRAYPRISELTCHRRIHTGEKPFACKTCGKAFRVSSKMTTHMRSHTDIRPYKCTQCERSFKYSKDLSIHFRIHTGERPYSCNICGRTFTQSNTLKTHRVKLGHIENDLENANNIV